MKCVWLLGVSLLMACGGAATVQKSTVKRSTSPPTDDGQRSIPQKKEETSLPWKYAADAGVLDTEEGLPLKLIGKANLDHQGGVEWVVVTQVDTAIHHVLVLRMRDSDHAELVDSIDSISTKSVSVDDEKIQHRYESGTPGCVLVDSYDLFKDSLNLLETRMECGH